MTWAIVIVLLALCAALIGYLATLNRGLRRAGKQIRARMDSQSDTRLDLPCPNAAAEELYAAINHLFELRQKERSQYLHQEADLRRQIADVSHDLRTPLTSILGYLQLLEEQDLTPDQRKEYMEVVRGRSAVLQTLIASFYDLSRAEGGQWPLEREALDLGRIVADQLAVSYESLENAGMAPEVDIQEDLPPVWGDQNAAVRVVSNLLTNALRHGKPPLRVCVFGDRERVVTRFTNAAPDMKEEDAQHVFERFYTADRVRTGQNTGLGLAIVKALTQRMGCQSSAYLEGGLFTIEVRWTPARFE